MLQRQFFHCCQIYQFSNLKPNFCNAAKLTDFLIEYRFLHHYQIDHLPKITYTYSKHLHIRNVVKLTIFQI